MTIITEFYSKIKLYLLTHLEEVGIGFIIILVGISSFLLGRYSVLDHVEASGITIENNGIEVSTSTPKDHTTPPVSKGALKPTGDSSEVVASKNGTKYYLPWCGAVARIKDENKVYFASAFEAEKAGFAKATNCKGM